MRGAVRVLLVALSLLAAIPAETSAQSITVEQLEEWARDMNQFRTGPTGCPNLVNQIQGIIGDIVAEAESQEDTGWEWVDDFGVGVVGWTTFEYNTETGEIRQGTVSTQLSSAERDRSTESDFLWGVAHEALHWVTAVGVKNGVMSNMHLGGDWQRLDDCFIDVM